MREGDSGGPPFLVESARVAEGWILVLDTCASYASVALFQESALREERILDERNASSALLRVVREVLAAQGIGIQDLAGMGVVRGPGSFTGVRIGLALAKGLCEAAAIPLAGVSRLEVLADAASLSSGFALLEAGRDQIYLRAIHSGTGAQEWLSSLAESRSVLQGAVVAIVCTAPGTRLHTDAALAGAELRAVDLTAKDAIGPVLRNLARGETPLAELDANYVRNEDTIYARQSAARQDAAVSHVADS